MDQEKSKLSIQDQNKGSTLWDSTLTIMKVPMCRSEFVAGLKGISKQLALILLLILRIIMIHNI